MMKSIREEDEAEDENEFRTDLMASFRKKNPRRRNGRIKRSLSADAVKIAENKMF
jgi:hypothetical protein